MGNIFKRLNEALLLEYSRADMKALVGDEYTNKFVLMRQKFPAPYNDLNYWIKQGDPEALKTYIDEWESGKQKSKTQTKNDQKMDGATLITNEKGWKVYRITSYKASAALGSGTTWCTTGRYHGYESQGQYFYNKYIREQNLDGGYYFVFDTLHRNETTGDYEKYCVGVRRNKSIAFIYNSADSDIKSIVVDDSDRVITLIPGVEVPMTAPITVVNGVLTKADQSLDYKSLVIPEGVVEIKHAALESRTFAAVQFNSDLKKIGNFAFHTALNCSTIVIPGNVETIGKFAFSANSNLIEVVIEPGSLTEIPAGCFSECRKLNDITIPDNVTKVEPNAFYDCQNLLRINGDTQVCIDLANSLGIECVSAKTGEVLNNKESE